MPFKCMQAVVHVVHTCGMLHISGWHATHKWCQAPTKSECITCISINDACVASLHAMQCIINALLT